MRRFKGGLGRSLLLMTLLAMPLLATRAFGVDTSKFQTASLLEQYRGEQNVCTKWQQDSECCTADQHAPLLIRYFNQKERMKYKLQFKNGHPYLDGKMLPHLIADEDPNSEVDYQYTMDPKGNIYIYQDGPLAACRIHHSSFVDGKQVAGAGHLKIEKGEIMYIDNCSGHYHPSDPMLDQVVEVLKEHDVTVKEKNYYGGKSMAPYRH
jgi:hypothetical protein